MRNQLGVAVVVVMCACGGGGGDQGVVTIHALGSPLVVGQDGDGAWEQLALDADGVAQLNVTSGFYGVIGFCTSALGPSARAEGRFAVDFADVDMSCGSGGTSSRISGVTAPDAMVYAGLTPDLPADAAGMYGLFVHSGLHDVFAVLEGTPSRLLVRRGVDASSDVTLDLPIETEGIDMPTMTPVVTGALSDQVSVYADLTTGSFTDYVFFGSGPTSTPIPPASVVVATDHAAIGASTHTADGSVGCGRQVPLGPTPPTLELPALYSADFDTTQLVWDADDAVEWELAALSLRPVFQPGQTRAVSATFYSSGGWLDAAGAGQVLSVPDLSTLPGWTPELAAFAAGQEIRWNTWTNRGVPEGDYTICAASGTITW
jgi:hypothetical protein